MNALAWVLEAMAAAGLAQGWAGAAQVARFAAAPAAMIPDPAPITILKPLCGNEKLLGMALESFFLLDYPSYQLVFGVQDQADPVLPVLADLQARYPAVDAHLVLDPTPHGRNRKIANLINMLPSAKHDILVISDADIHAPADFLRPIAASLAAPDVGLVTTLYTGLPAHPGLPARIGADAINHVFAPGALLARAMGRQDCLGATMALRRTTLAQIGGLAMLSDHLADDNVLGRLVREAGFTVALAPCVPATSVPEADWASLVRHELRWARTIRALAPLPYAASVLQYPLAWAVLALICAGGAPASWLILGVACLLRYRQIQRIDRALGVPPMSQAWSLLLRDLLSFGIFITSYISNEVSWRANLLHADSGRPNSAL